MALAWLYLFELWRLTKHLRESAPELWRSLGEPTLGAAGRKFLLALAGGHLAREPLVPPRDRRAAARMGVYLFVALPLWLGILAILLFRRQFGLAL
jgi:hypothetical protein